MSVLILLIGISLVMSGGFVWACIVSIRAGQFDDLESPRWRLFFPDAIAPAAAEPLAFTPPRPERIPGEDKTI